MKDVGIHPVLKRMAQAALKASKGADNDASAVALIMEALKPGVQECVEIGVDQAIIAADDRKRVLRFPR